MKRNRILLVVLLAGCGGLWAGVEFQALSLEQALQRAAEQKKVVFVDFFTTWCMPCKMMDESTWKDGKVGDWLAKNAIAIRLDAEKERQAARKYKVAAVPSMVFIKPDGGELDRIEGIRDAEGFLGEATAICSGEDPYVRARRILGESGDDNLNARMKYARKLVGLGKPDEALTAYLWCYDKVAKDGPAFIASQVIAGLGNLAKTLPAVHEALKPRLDQALARLDKEAWTMEGVADVLDMSRIAGSDLAARLARYDRLKPKAGQDGKAGELTKLFMDELLEARRYAELAGVLEPEKAAENCLREIALKKEWGRNNSDSPMYGTSLKVIEGLIGDACKHYEILMGCGEEAKAASLAENLLRLDGSASTLKGLAWSGLLLGRPSRVHLELAEKAWAQSKEKDAEILDTLCRLLARFDGLPRAEALVREFQKQSGDEKMNEKLERCLDEARLGLPPSRTFGDGA